MVAHPTRRALLGSVAVAVAGAVAALAVAATADAGQGVSPALVALIAEADRREAVADEYERNVYDPAAERWRAAEAVIPHVSFEAEYVNYAGIRPILTTANPAQVATAKALVERPLAWADNDENGKAYNRCKRRLFAASKWRQRALDCARRQSGVDKAYDGSCWHSDLVAEADNAVTSYPAATLPDLVAMLDFMERRGSASDDDCVAALAAGIRRLAKQVQA